MACLDTSVLLDLRGRGGKKLQQRAQEKILDLAANGEDLTTTMFTLAELWVGVARAADAGAEEAAMSAILAPLRVLDFDSDSAQIFGRVTAHLQRLGQPAGDMDVLIASVALQHDQIFVTRNLKHFECIPGLRLESY